jgi:hypothetical protein
LLAAKAKAEFAERAITKMANDLRSLLRARRAGTI